MAIDISEVRARLLASKQRDRQSSSGGDNASYPFWDIPFDSTATVRFLPDGDPNNPFCWVERLVIKLPFAGIVGSDNDTDREITVTVPCVEMFGMTCPIISGTRDLWKDDSTKEIARKYWKKRSYLMQGFVIDSPINETNPPENPIRRFVINPTLFEVIEKAILDPDLTDVPYDYVGGRDFRITKTRKGEWANYSSSSFSMKTRSLNETELMAIEKYGLFNLKEFLGRVPDSDELAALKAMLDASLRGEPYDYASFGKYYKPFSRGGSDASISEAGARQVAETVPAKPVTSETHGGEPAFQASLSPATVAAAPVTTGKPDPREIIERIRQRTAAQ
jgi:hypothetical protein